MSDNKQEEFKKQEELAKQKLSETEINADEIFEKEENKTNVLDGFREVNKNKMPFNGVFYPKNWGFYYKCPTTKDVANFSTIDENNQPGIIKAVTALITKYFTIVDIETQKTIPSENINDGDRLYFFLLLREYYLHDAPIKYNILDDEGEVLKINFVADSLVYPEYKQGLIDKFNGRKFSFDYKGSVDGDKIEFLIPTLRTSLRLIKYMETLHKKVSDNNQDGIKKEDFNKQFLLFAPYLYETGSESVMSLRKKFINLQKNENKFKAFNNIVNKLSPQLTNKQEIRYIINDNEGDCLMKFPGGWKNMFNDTSEFSEIF